MKVLLSIKPEYAFKIFDGSKRYEFRKNIFRRKNIDKVVVYASSPVQKVIGEFEIVDILHEKTELLWEITQQYSGISKEFYDQYFEDRDHAFAIKVGRVKEYSCPKLLSDFNIDFAPQSFAYL
jgi:predicted transcriptional regulator